MKIDVARNGLWDSFRSFGGSFSDNKRVDSAATWIPIAPNWSDQGWLRGWFELDIAALQFQSGSRAEASGSRAFPQNAMR